MNKLNEDGYRKEYQHNGTELRKVYMHRLVEETAVLKMQIDMSICQTNREA